MNWRFCVSDPQKRALDHCDGSMDDCYVDDYPCGTGYGDGEGDCYVDDYSWGFGVGDGASPKEWK